MEKKLRGKLHIVLDADGYPHGTTVVQLGMFDQDMPCIDRLLGPASKHCN